MSDETIKIITLVIALLGALTGVTGLILSMLNFFRDNPKIKVTFQWDGEFFGNIPPGYEKGIKYGSVTITNAGRRPIFVRHAYIEVPEKISLPDGLKRRLLLADGLKGEKLAEGDRPLDWFVKQDEDLKKYKLYWKRMRACVLDSTGKVYISAPVRKEPSWAV